VYTGLALSVVVLQVSVRHGNDHDSLYSHTHPSSQQSIKNTAKSSFKDYLNKVRTSY